VDRIAAHRGGDPVDACQYPSVLDYLAVVPDPRHPRGVRHRLVAVLAVAVCAVLAGARSFAAIGEWAADVAADVLAVLGVRADPWNPPQPPDEATVRRVLSDVDGDMLDAAIGAWLRALSPPPAPLPVEPPTPREGWPVAVDGKSLRGCGEASSGDR
jgi:hypothetical protein